MFEQLWYTSSAVGLEGGGLQVRAASPGLSDLGTAVATAAKRLCHFTPPPASLGVSAVSFGWADLKAVRFVFRRCTAGRDTLGRPQVFSHVVAGPATELPPQFVVERFASPFWRSDDDGLGDSTALPRIAPDEIGAGAVAPLAESLITACLQAFVEARAGRRRLVIVSEDPALVAALVAGLAVLLPREAFGGIRSFSTYEPQESAQAYGVVGVLADTGVPPGSVVFDPKTPQRQGVSAPVSPLAQRLRTGVHPVAVQAADTGEGFRFDVLMAAAEALDGLEGDQVPAIDELLPVLRSAEGALVVVRSPVGRTSLARAAIGGRAEVWHALGLAPGSLQRADLRALGAEIGATAVEGLVAGRDVALRRVLAAAGALSTELAAAITEAIVGNEDARSLEGLADDDRLEVVRAIAHHHIAVPARQLATLLRCAPATAARIAALPGLPQAWRAHVTAHALTQATDAGALRSFAAALAGDRALLVGTLAIARTLPDGIRAVSSLAGSARLDVAQALIECAADARWSATDEATLVLAYVDRFDVVDPLDTLSSWLGAQMAKRGRVRVAPKIITSYRLLLATDLLTRAKQESQPVGLTRRDERIIDRLADHPRQGTSHWQRLFERLHPAARTGWARFRPELAFLRKAILSMPVGHERDAAVIWSMEVLLLSCRSASHVDELQDFLHPWLGGDVGEFARRLTKSANRQSNIESQPAVTVLVWFLHAIEQSRIATRGAISPRLGNEDLQRCAESVAKRTRPRGLAQVDDEAKRVGGKPARWWRSIRSDRSPDPARLH